ncbi:glycosyltransferase family 2 protein [Rhodovulum sp. YNF3179]|uniref:glycosyltransferase family 2 protein n=1 Tax=Rhodovulum sp. YNF3179 TaxID=3425127 RepID=UPI003D346E07
MESFYLEPRDANKKGTTKMRFHRQKLRMALVFTAHNRKEKTKKFLDFWSSFAHPFVEISIFACDDGSVDGTRDLMEEYCQNYSIGSGALFWAGGMRRAYELIDIEKFDALIVANDDIYLKASEVRAIIDQFCNDMLSIHIGKFVDEKGLYSYGGLRQNKFFRASFKLSENDEEVDTFNMNFAIIPTQLIKRIGFLSKSYTHSKADIDFGLRAKVDGVNFRVYPVPLGICNRNSDYRTSKDRSLGFVQRWRLLLSTKEQPIKERIVFCSKHGGWFWPLLVVQPYLELIIDTAFMKSVSWWRWLKHAFSSVRASLKLFWGD